MCEKKIKILRMSDMIEVIDKDYETIRLMGKDDIGRYIQCTTEFLDEEKREYFQKLNCRERKFNDVVTRFYLPVNTLIVYE